MLSSPGFLKNLRATASPSRILILCGRQADAFTNDVIYGGHRPIIFSRSQDSGEPARQAPPNSALIPIPTRTIKAPSTARLPPFPYRLGAPAAARSGLIIRCIHVPPTTRPPLRSLSAETPFPLEEPSP